MNNLTLKKKRIFGYLIPLRLKLELKVSPRKLIRKSPKRRS